MSSSIVFLLVFFNGIWYFQSFYFTIRIFLFRNNLIYNILLLKEYLLFSIFKLDASQSSWGTDRPLVVFSFAILLDQSLLDSYQAYILTEILVIGLMASVYQIGDLPGLSSWILSEISTAILNSVSVPRGLRILVLAVALSKGLLCWMGWGRRAVLEYWLRLPHPI